MPRVLPMSDVLPDANDVRLVSSVVYVSDVLSIPGAQLLSSLPASLPIVEFKTFPFKVQYKRKIENLEHSMEEKKKSSSAKSKKI